MTTKSKRGKNPESSKPSNEELQFLLSEFDLEFPTEETWLRKLHEAGTGSSEMVCRNCRSSDMEAYSGGRSVRCKWCHTENWFTSGTMFEGTREPRAWLACMWLADRGYILSSNRFAKLIGVEQSTAWCMQQKIYAVLVEKMPQSAPEIDSVVFDEIIFRRSLQTPATEHPRAEGRDKKHRANTDASAAAGGEENRSNGTEETSSANDNHRSSDASSTFDPSVDNLSAVEQSILQLLTETEPTHFDDLSNFLNLFESELSAALTYLELSGLARAVGGSWLRVSPPTKKATRSNGTDGSFELSMSIDFFKSFIRKTQQGISRKTSQRYLAAFWCQTDKGTWSPGRLLIECARHSKISYDQLLEYVSPAQVKLVGFA